MPKLADEPERGSNGRLRQFTFQPRKQYPLRLPRDVYNRLRSASEVAAMTNTMYVSTVLELWLAGPRDIRHLESFVELTSPDERRITVTIRLLPNLYKRAQAFANGASVSLNRLVTFILDGALRGG